MKNVTVIFGDTHYGYNQKSYPWKNRRLHIMQEATDTLAGYIRDMQHSLRMIIHMGDATEKLFPTWQHDPKLAQQQARPLGKALRETEVPFVQIAGNADPYYDPVAQNSIRAFRSLSKDRDPVEREMRVLWSDFGSDIRLSLPGITYRDGTDLYTHGHWTDDLASQNDGDLFAEYALTNRHKKKALIEYLRASETSHQWQGRIYETASWPIAALPGSLRRFGDRTLERRMSTSQAAALGEYTAKLENPPPIVVAGHVHAPTILALDSKRVYLNPGTLTGIAKLDTAEPRTTFATITEEVMHRTIRLFLCRDHRVEELQSYNFEEESPIL